MSARPDPAPGGWPAGSPGKPSRPATPSETAAAEVPGDTAPGNGAPAGTAPGNGAPPRTAVGDTADGGTAADDLPEAGDEQAGGGTILTDVAALAAERDEYLSALQHLKADFDNYRKRVLRQQGEQAARAAGELVGKLLPVLDNLDLAWAHLGETADSATSEEARALGQARAQLLDVLGREGLERVDEVGVPFDPTVHDAVAHAPAAEPAAADGATPTTDPAGEEPTARGDEPTDAAGTTAAAGGGGGDHGVSVDDVMRAGYRWRGQVLRPAMVRVRG